MEGEPAGLAAVLDVGMRKGAWSKGDPPLGFELGSWVAVGPYLVEKSRLAAETQLFGLGCLQGHGWEGSVAENGIPRLWAGTSLLCHLVLPFPSLYMVAHAFPPHPREYPQNPSSRDLATTKVSTHLGQLSPSEGSTRQDGARWRQLDCRLKVKTM